MREAAPRPRRLPPAPAAPPTLRRHHGDAPPAQRGARPGRLPSPQPRPSPAPPRPLRDPGRWPLRSRGRKPARRLRPAQTRKPQQPFWHPRMRSPRRRRVRPRRQRTPRPAATPASPAPRSRSRDAPPRTLVPPLAAAAGTLRPAPPPTPPGVRSFTAYPSVPRLGPAHHSPRPQWPRPSPASFRRGPSLAPPLARVQSFTAASPARPTAAAPRLQHRTPLVPPPGLRPLPALRPPAQQGARGPPRDVAPVTPAPSRHRFSSEDVRRVGSLQSDPKEESALHDQRQQVHPPTTAT